ncbi:hypothetical protein BDM02DRAFT_3097345 [Thelephora ganbajun]|uniref:Uncharacterized protein n=1 Tax=Thelephora ganbajun TaxID=370292 RepID=A0ACB6ZEM0_THEGA|nr:hypothetical protein BDM02DRAFT_3097345 [Thelephora ganbajun]
MRNILFTAIAASIPLARAHIAFYDPSMWGYGVRSEDYPYDNRPETPLQQYTFDKWWFHGHLAHPPEPGNFFELPAGGVAVSQLACNKGATKWWAVSEGHTDIRQGDYPCPNSPLSEFHVSLFRTLRDGHDDLKGCALSIAYTSDVNSIKPEDLAIFSVNHECVWKVNTAFQIPKDMPSCPPDGCICGWHWIHSVDSGSAQMYMNGFRCKVTGSTSNNPIVTPQVPKRYCTHPSRCTGDLSKCNQGAQQPLYWFQAEGNNMFNGQYDPPYYLDEWGFTDGAQNNIFNKRNDNSNVNTTPPADNKPTSTSADQPVSTPADNKPAPTPSSPPKDNNTNSGNSGDPSKPSPSSSSPSSSVPPQSSPSSSPVNDNAAAPSPSPTNDAVNDPSS